MSFWKAQPSSKLGRSIVTQVTTAQTNASVTTTNFGSQTYQVRIVHNLTPIWATIDTTATVTAKVLRRICRPVRQSILP